MSAVPAVRVSGVVRRFGYFRALDGVDLEAWPGETVLLLGPNGAGKTTLLRVLAGLLLAKGEVEIHGRPPRGNEGGVRARVGYLSHNLALYPDLTAAENLRFFARLYRVGEVEERVRSLLKEVDLEGWRDEPVRTYSRGMKQRLAIARVLLHEPDVLLLDEPFTGLDLESARFLAGRIDERKKAGAATLLATHRLESAAPIGDRAVLLRKGKVASDLGLAELPVDERGRRLEEMLGGGER